MQAKCLQDSKVSEHPKGRKKKERQQESKKKNEAEEPAALEGQRASTLVFYRVEKGTSPGNKAWN